MGRSFTTVGAVGLLVTLALFVVVREPIVMLSLPAFLVFFCVGVYLVMRRRRDTHAGANRTV